jgi:hypothetical protein
MEDRDLAILAQLVKEYPVQNIMEALEKVVSTQADELVDSGYGHSEMAKELTLAAWHLHLFNNK